jgi:non-specific serine/threonine protein kinase
VLLVLDNVEHVLPAAPLVADLLAACPGLSVLATSRAALNLSGEQLFPVAPLPLSDATDLFIARARAVQPDFAPDDAAAAPVAEICHRLDGLPLAIELAAARVAALPLQALLDRLDQSLRVLTGGPRDAPARLQTLRDAIAWSHDLLTPGEQILFRRLAVFAGGFTLEAAETVTAGGEAGRQEGGELLLSGRLSVLPSALDGIASLTTKSLLQRQDALGRSGDARYAMLETIRQFAAEMLEASGEGDAVRARHLACFADLAEAHRNVWIQENFDRLDADRDNSRSALAWAIEHGEPLAGMRLAGFMWVYWRRAGRFAEGLNWAERSLAAGSPEASAARAEAAEASCSMARMLGDYELALARTEECLAIRRKIGDARGIPNMYFMRGLIALDHGQYELAEHLFNETLTMCRPFGKTSDFYLATWGLSIAAVQSGDLDLAMERLVDAVADAREHSGPFRLAMIIGAQAEVTRRRGDRARAVREYAEALRWNREAGDPVGASECLAGLAALAGSVGQADVAAHLGGAVLAIRETTGHQAGHLEPEGWMETAFGPRFGPNEQRAALAIGRSIPLDTVVAEAFLFAETYTEREEERVRLPGGAVLSPREAEILRLLAAGHSDPEIAAALFVSPRTVEWHVANLYRKFELHSRAAVAAQAVRLGIV